MPLGAARPRPCCPTAEQKCRPNTQPTRTPGILHLPSAWAEETKILPPPFALQGGSHISPALNPSSWGGSSQERDKSSPGMHPHFCWSSLGARHSETPMYRHPPPPQPTLALPTLLLALSLYNGCCGLYRAPPAAPTPARPPGRAADPNTHVEVPEGEDSDDHGCGGPAPAAGAVEHKGCP